ncbi:protein licC [Gallibacterium genomosp. 3]|uniref:Protein licC n=1 Tax=Gallibacterium genomosp. 3 TaxID=505345 RepID=A0A1A7NQX9_9PAST|nr:NTP transferase domain-containing protein [Gallibacterium genomosp. 3]OBW92038.1 protein licC [Gallibacterium genomosp. 3]
MNAIILAAGLGSRFKDFVSNSHKALLPISSIPNIERTIKFLQEANIYNIFIVTGYNSHLFEYLHNKYKCKIIYNEKYKEYNSIYSFFKISNYFKNSYVIDADVVLFRNVFLEKLENSTYFLVQRSKKEKEWIPILDKTGIISQIDVSDDEKPSLLGISFWKENDSFLIKKELSNYLSIDTLSNPKYYWDDIPRKLIFTKKLAVKTFLLNDCDAGEMDTVEDYLNLLKYKNS